MSGVDLCYHGPNKTTITPQPAKNKCYPDTQAAAQMNSANVSCKRTDLQIWHPINHYKQAMQARRQAKDRKTLAYKGNMYHLRLTLTLAQACQPLQYTSVHADI